MLKLTAVSLMALSLAVPAFAQTSTGHSAAAMDAPATHSTAGSPTANGYGSASERNDVMTGSGGMRVSKIVGSSVYNEHDQKIGSIDDVLLRSDKATNAVVSVGGFLGMGSKLVEVPFGHLQFGNTKGSDDNRVVLPGATKESLKAMPEYHFKNS